MPRGIIGDSGRGKWKPRSALMKGQREQDRRIDLPTIGPETLRRAAEAGLAGVIVEAGAVLVAGVAETAEAADRLGLFVEGVRLG